MIVLLFCAAEIPMPRDKNTKDNTIILIRITSNLMQV